MGVTSLRVIIATVVLLLARLRGRLLGLILVLNKLGLMTGVNEDWAGRVKVSLDLEAGLTVEDESNTSLSISFPEGFSTIELEAKVKSSSNSLKSAPEVLLATKFELLFDTGLLAGIPLLVAR